MLNFMSRAEKPLGKVKFQNSDWRFACRLVVEGLALAFDP